MNDFDYDVMQKKRIARMAKYRKGGSKSKKCPMSTDYMTRKQWEERCGEVHTYVMNEPKSWEQFKELPTNIQKEYLTHLVQNYNANATSLAMMFGVRPLTVRRHIETNQLGLTFKVGNSMNADQKAKWQEFLSETQVSDETAGRSDEASAKVEEVPNSTKEAAVPVQPQLINSMKGMDMKQFSLTFQGQIDVGMIANSILSIIGQGATGKVEIVCTL
jgi:hypothetical protein